MLGNPHSGSLTSVATTRLVEGTRRRVLDSQLNTSVPAQLVTYRTLVEQYAGAAGEEVAYGKLGEMYEDLRRYDLAAQAFFGKTANRLGTDMTSSPRRCSRRPGLGLSCLHSGSRSCTSTRISRARGQKYEQSDLQDFC